MNRMSQAQFSQLHSLKIAQQTVYQMQLRQFGTLLVPLNARLTMLNVAAMEDEEALLDLLDEDIEDDTL